MPETQYAQSGELSIAYQCVGEGPLNLLFIPGFVSNVELMWDLPGQADLLTRLSALGRLVVFDKRGTGCSDRTLGTGSAEDRMDDTRAVADAAGIDQAVVIGVSEGGPLAVLFAAAFPERVRSLVLWGTFARLLHAPDYGVGVAPELAEAFISFVRGQWGRGNALKVFGTDVDDDMLKVLARYERQTASPGAVADLLRHNVNMDVRHALGALRVPTLIVHRTGDPIVPVAHARYLAEHIAGAQLVEIAGDFHVGSRPADYDPIIDAIAEFVTGRPTHREVEVDRLLTTVLFTDIVESTARAASMGDRAWRTLLEQHDNAAGQAVTQHRGVVVKRTGDGLLATFDGPGRGIRAAHALQAAVRPLGIEVRAGLHTGEVERRADDIALAHEWVPRTAAGARRRRVSAGTRSTRTIVVLGRLLNPVRRHESPSRSRSCERPLVGPGGSGRWHHLWRSGSLTWSYSPQSFQRKSWSGVVHRTPVR